jgi:hypothetical protein
MYVWCWQPAEAVLFQVGLVGMQYDIMGVSVMMCSSGTSWCLQPLQRGTHPNCVSTVHEHRGSRMKVLLRCSGSVGVHGS